MISGRGYDQYICEVVEPNRKIILAGECALQRCGLTTYLADTVQAWTMVVGFSGIENYMLMWYFNPFAEDPFCTNIGCVNSNILEPTQERALVEYIAFNKYFDEGILIEGLKNYLYQNDDDYSKLYPVADKIYLPHSWVDYWVNEAKNDYDD